MSAKRLGVLSGSLLGFVLMFGAVQARAAGPTTVTQTTVANAEPAASVVGDDQGTCVLLRSGGVECWGNNTYGALGDGTVTTLWYTSVPLAAKGLVGVTHVVSALSAKIL
jgi:hypothetical protein